MKRKITQVLLVLLLLLTPTSVFALDTVGETDAFKEFTEGDVTYYDVFGGQTEGRPEVTDVDQLIQQVLYEKREGQAYSVAEYWAALATSIYASNPASWRIYGNDGNHGNNKDYQDFQDRLSLDPAKDKDDYGNVQKWLSSKNGTEISTGNKDKYRKCDINMKASGMMTAQSLAEVEDMAFQYLVDVNPGKIKTSDFNKYNSLPGMNEESSAGDVIYHLMATRDRDGGTFYYDYNCFGIAFYDFQAIPFTGAEGEGLTTALKEYENLDDAVDDTENQQVIEGFEYDASATNHIDRVRNTSEQDMTKEISGEWSMDEELSSEITKLKGMSFSQEESAEFTFGKDTGFFHAAAGFSFTEEELFQEGLNTTNSTTRHEGGSSANSVTVPAHTALEQVFITSKTDSTARYDCPVMITYKVAIFSYCGEYYDDNTATTYFTTAGYEQRSFMTVFGNDTDGAVESLRTCMRSDAGYDSSYRLTRGIRDDHGAGSVDAGWDTPWVNHLDYAAMKDAADNYLHYSPSYDETTQFLSTNQPISITGGLLSRQATATETIVGEAIPIYPLDSITLVKSQRDLITLKQDEDLHLKNIQMEAWDSEGIEFYKYIFTDGYWAIVNKNGEKKDSSDVIRLYKNKNGEYVVRGVEPGRAYIKYFVPEGKYRYINSEDTIVMIEPEDVETPTLTITVKETKETADKIAVQGGVSIYYDDPGDPETKAVVDLNSVDGLEAVVYNTKGNVMEVQAQWRVADGTTGVEIEGNMMTVNEDGDYQIYAEYGDIISETTGVHVEKNVAEASQPSPEAEAAVSAVSSYLQCDSEYASLGEACLFVKNIMGQQCTLNEVIFTETLMQMAGVQASTEEQKAYELEAVVWAIENGLISNADGYTLSLNGGVTELQMAVLAYNASIRFGADVSCEDVISSYIGSETLTENQRAAMNWAISKGTLSETEEATLTLDLDRLITDAELDSYHVPMVANPEAPEA